MSSIREKLGLNNNEDNNQTSSIREKLGITKKSLEDEKNDIELQQRIKEENSKTQVTRKTTGLKWIDANLNNIDDRTYQNAVELSDYQKNKTGGTILNTLSELGKGVGDFAESVGDTMLQIGSSKYNPFMHLLYNGDVDDGQKIAQEIIQEDSSQKFFDETLGYQKVQSNGKTLQQNLDENSYIKSDNLGGTIARGIGNMLPSIALGNAGAGNIGSMLSMGINSYGSGIDEAYDGGATRAQANLYGLGNAAIETATEWVTGGIPGVQKVGQIAKNTKLGKVANFINKLNLDTIADKGLDKVSNKIVKEILNAGYKMVGEGGEEVLSELLNPILKNATYSSGEKVNGNAVLQSFLAGAITGGILEAPINVSNIKSGIAKQSQINANKQSNVRQNLGLETNTQGVENTENLNYNINEGDTNGQRNILPNNGQSIENDSRGTGGISYDSGMATISSRSSEGNVSENRGNSIAEGYQTREQREIVHRELQDEMGITVEDLQIGKDISSLEYQRTDPIRLNEKVFGTEIGKKINDATINKTKHNEAERIRFLNKERNEIKNLGIKPRSKESAAVQKYGEKQYINDKGDVITYSDANLAAEFPNIETQQKIKRAAEVIRNKYDKYIDTINQTITELGYDPIPKRKDYMRHFQELNDKFTQWGLPLNRQSLNENNIPTDINGLTDQFKPGKNWFASAMQRKGLKTTYDAITGIDGYLDGASNLMYHTEDIQRYRALSKLVRDTFGQTHGLDNVDLSTEEGQKRLNDIYDNKLSKYAAWLDEQANALAGKKGAIDRGTERVLGRRIYSVLDAAKKQVGSNMTGFNVRSALTNFASAIQGASKTNKLAFIKGTISTVQNMIHNDGLIDKSDFLTSRLKNDSQLSKKLWQKVSNAGQILMKGIDYFTANQIWRSKYYENLSKGMNETQAIKNADDFSSRIMGDRSKGSTAEIFNSKTLGLLTQFQLEVNNQWSSLIHDNKIDIKNGNKTGATILFQMGQLAAMSYMFNNFMKSVTGSGVMIDPIDLLKKIFDSDDEDDKGIEERATSVLGDIVNNLPFASVFTGGRIPVSEAFKGISTGFKYATGQSDNYGNKYKLSDVGDDLIESAFYWLLPTGYGQVKKTIKGASMYSGKLPTAGSYTNSGNLRFTADESVGGKIKAALFGQYSSKEAQDYIDSGYKTISKNNIQEMKDLNMTSSEYRQYRQGLSSSGTKNADKIEYINSLDVSNKQKNIMANNVINSDKYNIDMSKYNDYDSYEEYDYSLKNQYKYNTFTNFGVKYSDYKEYEEKIKQIKEQYSGTENTNVRKEKVKQYIQGLPYKVETKLMLYNMIGGYSIKEYKNEMFNYIESMKLTAKEKQSIYEYLYK